MRTRDKTGRFIGDKYKKMEGVWYKGICEDCYNPVKGHLTRKCHECYWKGLRHPVEIAGTKHPHYHAVHWWMNKNFGRPNKCDHCGLVDNNTRRFHWANISLGYLKLRDDWLRLCASCHKSYDLGRKGAKE